MAIEHAFDIEIYTPPLPINGAETKAALQAAINALRNEAQFAILESLTDIRFPRPSAMDINLDEWPKGRLFAPNFELRWEKSGEGYRVVFVKETDFKTHEAVSSFLSQKDSEIAEQFWGREDQEVYLWPENEPRLGRSLDYQCLDDKRTESNQNVKLKIAQYYDEHGRLIFWRYKAMRWES